MIFEILLSRTHEWHVLLGISITSRTLDAETSSVAVNCGVASFIAIADGNPCFEKGTFAMSSNYYTIGRYVTIPK
jgi:hypothetical protein